MTDPDVKNLRKLKRVKRRAEMEAFDAVMSYYRSVQFNAFGPVEPERPKTRSPIERLGHFLSKR